MKINDALTIILNAVSEAMELDWHDAIELHEDWFPFPLTGGKSNSLRYFLWASFPNEASSYDRGKAQIIPAIKNAFEQCEDQEGLVDAYLAYERITK